MADENTPEKAVKAPESPTTARPIDFDDDQQETGVTSADTPAVSTPTKPPRTSSMRNSSSKEDAPPAKPPRPMSPHAQAEHTLIEAFPSMDAKVVKAVLVASGGQVEPAFNALLGMSDPDFKEEHPPVNVPSVHPRNSQMEQDELFARQLAAQYDRQHPQQRGAPGREQQQQRQAQQAWDEEEEGGTFEEDFAAIRENVRQGFLSTQKTVNGWLTDLRKKIDGESEDEIGPGPASQQQQAQRHAFQRQNFGPSQAEQMHGINKMAAEQRAAARRSTDQDRYDADNREIGDDFAELELRDDEAEAPPPKPARPTANPDLFKPTPPAPQSGPVDEVDALYRQPTPNSKLRQPSPSSGSKGKKWQPLTNVAPAPDADAEENDPFSLGDSEDEKEKKADVRAEDSERLKKAAGEKDKEKEKTDSKESKEGIEETERTGSSGTKDKVAEELLTGKK